MLRARELVTEGGRLVRFSAVGALAAAVYALTTFLVVALGLGQPLAATIIGHVGAGFVSYFGHLHYSFAVEPDHRVFLWRFVAIAVVALAVNITVTWLFTVVFKHSYISSIAVVTVLIPVVNYLSNRFWIFSSGLRALDSRTNDKA